MEFKEDIASFYKDKVVLLTGGVGSIGKELVKKLLAFHPKVIRVLDINETALFNLDQDLKSNKLRLFVGDIRDKDRLKMAMEGVDIVFHAAALKHVPLCEYNPFEAVKTNVLGTQNLVEAAINEEVNKFITISTDKAVNPVNVMGATKLLAEKLTISANKYKGARKTAFSVVRFGNVLNSRGSILPIIKSQIRKGEDVTLTHEEMTRFIMSIEEAVSLVVKAAFLAKGGEIFILKMPAVRIKDLIEVVIEELAPKYGYDPKKIKINKIGIRSGEKLYEELLINKDFSRVVETDDMFILTPYNKNKKERADNFTFTSQNARFLSKEEIKALLKKIDYL